MLRYVINLDRVPERWQEMSKRLDELGISVERVSAVDGSSFINGLPECYDGATVRFPRFMSAGEVACFLSHRECWKKLLESDEEWALCMEDDLTISDRAVQFMKDTNWIPSRVKILQLSALQYNCPVRIRKHTLHLDNKTELVVPLVPVPLGTQAYLISREAAQWAVNNSRKITCPVDEFLFSLWFEMANTFLTWRISPVCVIENGMPVNIADKNYRKKLPFYVRHGPKHFFLDCLVKLKRLIGIKSYTRFE